MAKFYTVKKEINGVEYTAQFNGISAALDAVDNSYIDDSENTSLKKMATYLFEHVIVEPKGLSIDDFDSMKDFNEVVVFARQVMQGELRPKENETATKAKSTK